jgi:hypothetical protein
MAISGRLECMVLIAIWKPGWTEICEKASETSRNTTKSSPNHQNPLKFTEYVESRATDWRIPWPFLVKSPQSAYADPAIYWQWRFELISVSQDPRIQWSNISSNLSSLLKLIPHSTGNGDLYCFRPLTIEGYKGAIRARIVPAYLC